MCMCAGEYTQIHKYKCKNTQQKNMQHNVVCDPVNQKTFEIPGRGRKYCLAIFQNKTQKIFESIFDDK